METVPQTVSIHVYDVRLYRNKESTLPKITRSYRSGRPLRLPLDPPLIANDEHYMSAYRSGGRNSAGTSFLY